MASRNVAALPLDIYSRVSDQGDRADERFHSHDIQRTTGEEDLKRLKREFTRTRYEDTDASGGSMSRPQFDRIIERIKNKESGGMWCATLDRFARNFTEGLMLL